MTEEENAWGLTADLQNIMELLCLNYEGVAWYGEFKEDTGFNDRILTEHLKRLAELGYLERCVLPKLPELGKVLDMMDAKAKEYWRRKGLLKLLSCDGRRPLYLSTEKGENEVCDHHDSLLER